MTDKATTKAILNLGLAHRWYINAPSHLGWDCPVASPVVVSQVRRFLEDTVEAPIPEAPLVLLRARCKAPIHGTSVLSPIRKTSAAGDRTHDPWV